MALFLLGGVLSSPGHSDPRTQPFDFQQKTPVVQTKTVSAPAKIRRYCQRLFKIYDKDEDGILQKSEWIAMKGSPSEIDDDRDGSITLREFESHVFEFGKNRSIRLVDPDDEEILDNNTNPATSHANPPNQENRGTGATETDERSTRTKRRTGTKYYIKGSRLPSNLPAWFVEKDKNGDGQISLSEYSPRQTNAELRAFRVLDTNNDGVITARELSPSSRKKKN